MTSLDITRHHKHTQHYHMTLVNPEQPYQVHLYEGTQFEYCVWGKGERSLREARERERGCWPVDLDRTWPVNVTQPGYSSDVKWCHTHQAIQYIHICTMTRIYWQKLIYIETWVSTIVVYSGSIFGENRGGICWLDRVYVHVCMYMTSAVVSNDVTNIYSCMYTHGNLCMMTMHNRQTHKDNAISL